MCPPKANGGGSTPDTAVTVCILEESEAMFAGMDRNKSMASPLLMLPLWVYMEPQMQGHRGGGQLLHHSHGSASKSPEIHYTLTIWHGLEPGSNQQPTGSMKV